MLENDIVNVINHEVDRRQDIIHELQTTLPVPEYKAALDDSGRYVYEPVAERRDENKELQKHQFSVALLFNDVLEDYILEKSGASVDYQYEKQGTFIVDNAVKPLYNFDDRKVYEEGIQAFGEDVLVDSSYHDMTKEEQYKTLVNCFDTALLNKGYSEEEIVEGCKAVALERWPEKAADINTTSHHR